MKIVKKQVELEEMVEYLRSVGLIACDTETTELDMQKLELLGIGFGTATKQFYIPFKAISLGILREVLTQIFTHCVVIFHHAKFDFEVMAKYKIPWPKKFHDTLIMSWLLDENTAHDLKYLAKNVLKRKVTNYRDISQGLTLFDTEESNLEKMAEYCGEDILNTYDLYQLYTTQLELEGLQKDYLKVELPFIPVLTKMEMRGVKIDTSWLGKLKTRAEKQLKGMEDNLYKLAKEPFNLHSPQQLERILFEKLGYTPLVTTKKGQKSTDVNALKELIKREKLDEDSFVAQLLVFREIDKIYTTYIVSLLEQADENGIVYTSFLQHGTRTGRLASREPNLQNIPIREDEWDIRRAFIPREGYKFIVADYSQMDLRVIAHFSKDLNMCKVFQEDGDIHTQTMKLTGVNRVTAKGINFGLIYGMGPRKLASQLDITEAEARGYITKYFEGYPMIKPYIRAVQQQTLKDSYVKTIAGRRRRFYDYNEGWARGLVERQSISTKISGSVADIMKIAMIKLLKPLETIGAQILIQIHDELVIEVPKARLGASKGIVKEVMENAVRLNIPLKVGIAEGDYWVKH